MPVFHVIAPKYDGNDDFEGATKFHASNHEAAAEKWAEYWDQDEYTLLQGETIDVQVQGADGSVKHFTVSGEATPTYYAREFKPESDDG